MKTQNLESRLTTNENYSTYLANLPESKRAEVGEALNHPFSDSAHVMRELYPQYGQTVELERQSTQTARYTYSQVGLKNKNQEFHSIGEILMSKQPVAVQENLDFINVNTLNVGGFADGDYPGWHHDFESWQKARESMPENKNSFLEYVRESKKNGVHVLMNQDLPEDHELMKELADRGYLVVTTSTMTHRHIEHDVQTPRQEDQKLYTLIDRSILALDSIPEVYIIPDIQFVSPKSPGNGPGDWSVANPNKGPMYEPSNTWFFGHSQVVVVELVNGKKAVLTNRYQSAASNIFQRKTNLVNAAKAINRLREELGIDFAMIAGDGNHQGHISQAEPFYFNLPPFPFAVVNESLLTHMIWTGNPAARIEVGEVLNELVNLDTPWVGAHVRRGRLNLPSTVSARLSKSSGIKLFEKFGKKRDEIGLPTDGIYVPHGHFFQPNEKGPREVPFSDHRVVSSKIFLDPKSDWTAQEDYEQQYRNIEALAIIKQAGPLAAAAMVELASGYLAGKAMGKL